MLLAFPKPSQVHKKSVVVRVFRDGREVCNQLTKAGRDEYEDRKQKMWLRQNKLCCLCGLPLAWGQCTFEHQDGRGMGGGHRDDRIEKDGQPYNGVSHAICNTQRGSRRTTFCLAP